MEPPAVKGFLGTCEKNFVQVEKRGGFFESCVSCPYFFVFVYKRNDFFFIFGQQKCKKEKAWSLRR